MVLLRLPAYEERKDGAPVPRTKCEEHGSEVVRKRMVRGVHAGREYWGCASSIPCEHFEWVPLKAKPSEVNDVVEASTVAAATTRLAGDSAQGRRVEARDHWADLDSVNGTLTRILFRGEDGFTVARLAEKRRSSCTETQVEKPSSSSSSRAFTYDDGQDVVMGKKQQQQHLVGIRASACLATARVGEAYSLRGAWVVHPRFGRQFEARFAARMEEDRLSSQEQASSSSSGAAFSLWLGSGVVSGVGPPTARKLCELLGTDSAEEILVRFATAHSAGAVDMDAAQRLGAVVNSSKGFSRDFVVRVAYRVAQEAASRAVIVALLNAGAPMGAAFALYKTHGATAVAELRHDAHGALLKCPGWGFSRADAVALSLGVRADDPMRLRYGVGHALQESAAEGHTAQTALEVLEAAASTYGPLATHDYAPENGAALKTALRDCVAAGAIKTLLVADEVLLQSAWLDAAEAAIARAVAGRLFENNHNKNRDDPPRHDDDHHHSDDNDDDDDDDFEASLLAVADSALSKEQRRAIRAALREKVLIIVGGPGTGKTRTARSVVAAWRRSQPSMRIALAAPTARGAAVLGAAIGAKATTIHRLLEWSAAEEGFSRDEQKPLEVDAVIVDEASMLDAPLAARLFASLPENARVLFIGDPHQLPSVGPGALLRDLLRCDRVPRAELTHIYRSSKAQAGHTTDASEASDIAQDATAINQGHAPSRLRPTLTVHGRVLDGAVFLEVDGNNATAVRDAIIATVATLADHGYDPLADVQILAPMKRGDTGTNALNRAMQDFLLLDHRRRHDNQGGDDPENKEASSFSRLRQDGTPETEDVPRHQNDHQNPQQQQQQQQQQPPQGNFAPPFLPPPGAPLMRPPPVLRPMMRPRDRVIQLSNDYDIGVFNGDIGIVETVFRNHSFVANFAVNGAAVRVMYSPEDLDDTIALAYALTVHKAQGAEYPVVVMPLVEDHFAMLRRPLLYTALTRAKRLLVLVGSRPLLDEAVRHGAILPRRTALFHRLDEALKPPRPHQDHRANNNSDNNNIKILPVKSITIAAGNTNIKNNKNNPGEQRRTTAQAPPTNNAILHNSTGVSPMAAA